jgi:Flp pilus assembly protein TadB
MLSIASAVAAFFKLILAFIGWQNREADRQAGAAEAVVEGNKKADASIAAANKAREDVRATHVNDPSSVLRDDDGFKRPD